MTELGLDPEAVVVREVDTDDAAERERFVGSPTSTATTSRNRATSR
jgi:hypothetical protein